jgi:hypothetical protein
MKFCSYIRTSGERYCGYRRLVREGEKAVTGYLKISCLGLLKRTEENRIGLNQLQSPVPGQLLNRVIFLSNASNASEICQHWDTPFGLNFAMFSVY